MAHVEHDHVSVDGPGETAASATSLQPTRHGYNPTAEDVLAAQLILEGLRLRSLSHLPTELALRILSLAAYEPRSVHHRAEVVSYRAATDFAEPGLDASVAALYLTAPPMPPGCRRAAWMTVQMRSADQGWATFGGNGTYRNSHTWFDVSILRPVAAGHTPQSQEPLESALGRTFRCPEAAEQALRDRGWQMVEFNGKVTWLAHHNITARREWRDYQVDWIAKEPIVVQDPPAMGSGEGFLDILMPGDKVALWARAEQLQWVHRVAEAVIEVGYEVW